MEKRSSNIGQQKGSKWTIRTLDAYARLDAPQLSVTRQHLQRLLDQEVFYCRIKAIEDVEYDGWVYDFEVTDHHNFVATTSFATTLFKRSRYYCISAPRAPTNPRC